MSMTTDETIARIKQIFMEVCNNQPMVVEFLARTGSERPISYRAYIGYYDSDAGVHHHIHIGGSFGTENYITDIDEFFDKVRNALIVSGIPKPKE